MSSVQEFEKKLASMKSGSDESNFYQVKDGCGTEGMYCIKSYVKGTGELRSIQTFTSYNKAVDYQVFLEGFEEKETYKVEDFSIGSIPEDTVVYIQVCEKYHCDECPYRSYEEVDGWMLCGTPPHDRYAESTSLGWVRDFRPNAQFKFVEN